MNAFVHYFYLTAMLSRGSFMQSDDMLATTQNKCRQIIVILPQSSAAAIIRQICKNNTFYCMVHLPVCHTRLGLKHLFRGTRNNAEFGLKLPFNIQPYNPK